MSIKTVLKVMLALVLIFASNALFVHPREVVNDSTALLQMLQREQPNRDVKRQGALLVTPTRVALGEEVEVVVEDISGRSRALVMIDSMGETLDIRRDPLGTQVFSIPENGSAGDYRFWLAWADLQAQSGLGVISVEVYDPIPGNLRHADPLQVAYTFVGAVQQLDSVLAQNCFVPSYFAGTDGWRWLFPEAMITWMNGEILFREVLENVETRVLVRVDIEVVRGEGVANDDAFWGMGTVQRYAVVVPTSTGWRIAEWLVDRPQDLMPPPVPYRPALTEGASGTNAAEGNGSLGAESEISEAGEGVDPATEQTDQTDFPVEPPEEGTENDPAGIEGSNEDPASPTEGEEQISVIPG